MPMMAATASSFWWRVRTTRTGSPPRSGICIDGWNQGDDMIRRNQAMSLCRQAIVATPVPAVIPGNENYIARISTATGKPCTGVGDVSGVVRDALNNLIDAYESTKLYDAAMKSAREFIERYPNDESILDKKIKVGSLYTKLGYYDQAILQFQNLIGEAGSLLEDIRQQRGRNRGATGHAFAHDQKLLQPQRRSLPL